MAHLRPDYLRCEYKENPLGVDARAPRLSWFLTSPERAERQTAYRIMVAGDQKLLAAGTPDLWDSGKVPSAETAQIEYAGKPLRSRQRCYWQVQVWNQNDLPSICSDIAKWEMGLLKPEDWQAEWVGIDGLQPEAAHGSLSLCPWVWGRAAAPQNTSEIPAKDAAVRSTDKGSAFDAAATNTDIAIQQGLPPQCYLRRTFQLGANPQDAWMLVKVAKAQLRLYVNGREVARCMGYHGPHWVSLQPWLVAGTNTLAIEGYNAATDTTGMVGRLDITTHSESHTIAIDQYWRASSHFESGWMNPDFDDSHWEQATLLSICNPDAKEAEEQEKPVPASHLRREFTVEGNVKHARLYATALGLYEPSLNGRRISTDCLAPGWTDYRKHIQYQVYDVTDMLVQGQNVLGAILGDGWYTGSVGGFGRATYGGYPLRFFAQLEIDYVNGQRDVLPTNESWLGSLGPIIHGDLIMGEIYDARKELPDWDVPGYSATGWRQVRVLPAPAAQIVSQPAPGVRVTEELTPIVITEPSPGTFIFDMGQNMVGVYRLKVKGTTGAEVTLRFGEMLNDNGTLYTENLRSARQTDVYILKGDPEGEVYQPHFTFHGFRYVEMTGYPGTPSLSALTGLVMHTAFDQVGNFACSDDMVNRLYSNIVWGQRGNSVSIPTDCPQRDERAGWTGDAQVFARTACMNMDAATFFDQYMVAVTDGQQPTGSIGHIAPAARRYGHGSPAWGDACVIIPWTIYQVYADKHILANHYTTMQRWIMYLKERSNDYIRPAEGFGDWLSVGADTPKEVVSTAFFAYSTHLLAKVADVLGYEDDARMYRELFAQIRYSFRRAFVKPDGRIYGDTQTCYLLGLKMELLPEELRDMAAQHLVRTVAEKDWHLSTGFIGVGFLLPILTEMGYSDVAYRLLHNDTYPSWGYSILQGATTIWERWNSYTKKDGFGDVGMNSFNHYSLGSVGEWLYRCVAGIEIDPEHPGYAEFIIRPEPGGSLTWAQAEYRSIRGIIRSSWKRDDTRLYVEVAVPTNTIAHVYLPLSGEGVITEGGTQIWPVVGEAGQVNVVGLGGVRKLNNRVAFEVAGGYYRFCVR